MNPTLVIDPVCGMSIDPSEAVATSTIDGMTHHFCSLGCKAEFDKGAKNDEADCCATAQPAQHACRCS